MKPRANPPGGAPALVLFDIDGTLLRRSGPHHRQVLVDAIRLVAGARTTTDHIPVQGMLDGDILTWMLRDAQVPAERIVELLPEIMERAQRLYARRCPDLRRKVTPGARGLLLKLFRAKIPVGLVTGNLSRIAWKKMERAGLERYFLFGAFAEEGHSRAELARIAIRRARAEGWIARGASISLIGDHQNDIRAAKANRIRSVAVATGLSTIGELAACSPDLLLPDLRSLELEALIYR